MIIFHAIALFILSGVLAGLQAESYNQQMFRSCILFLLLVAQLLSGCGPREIGQGTSYDPGIRPDAAAADLMRLPMTGMNNTQRMLYWYNNPEVMVNLQKYQRESYLRKMGIRPENPEYRAVPVQRSPFRQ